MAWDDGHLISVRQMKQTGATATHLTHSDRRLLNGNFTLGFTFHNLELKDPQHPIQFIQECGWKVVQSNSK